MKPFFKGMIIVWYGSVANIRKGWALCDGNNGTPDLLGISVIGAGGAFNPNDTGGATSHGHTFTGDGHTHPQTSMDTYPSGVGAAMPIASAQATGTTNPDVTRSPYYALCFIMKL